MMGRYRLSYLIVLSVHFILACNSETIGNTSKVDEDVDYKKAIPDYYFNNGCLDNKLNRIIQLSKDLDSDACTDAFIFINDEHWEYNTKVSPALIKYLDHNSNFSKILSSGDHLQNINNYQKAEINSGCYDFMKAFESATDKPWYSSIGNHEYLTSAYKNGLYDNVIVEEWANKVYFSNLKGAVVGDPQKMYYYVDNIDKKLRYIFLNTYAATKEQAIDDNTSRTVAVAHIGDKQLDWFKNIALDVESGWGIIIVAHSIVIAHYPNQTTNDHVIYIPQDSEKGYKDVVNIILNYHGNGEIIALLEGHMHRDGVDMVDDKLAQNSNSNLSDNAFFSICTTSDAGFFTSEGFPTEYMPYRVKGTLTEGAFDYCILNRKKHRLDMIRFGYPADLSYNYDGELEERAVMYHIQDIKVGDNMTLEHDFEGNVIWLSSDDSVATVKDGIVIGVSGGFAKIIGKDTLNRRAIVYIVKVYS